VGAPTKSFELLPSEADVKLVLFLLLELALGLLSQRVPCAHHSSQQPAQHMG
jgi:hypothetical protein